MKQVKQGRGPEGGQSGTVFDAVRCRIPPDVISSAGQPFRPAFAGMCQLYASRQQLVVTAGEPAELHHCTIAGNGRPRPGLTTQP